MKTFSTLILASAASLHGAKLLKPHGKPDLSVASMLTSQYTALESKVEAMILGQGPTVSQLVAGEEGPVDLATAAKQLQGRLPPEISSMLHTAEIHETTGNTSGNVSLSTSAWREQFDEASIARARGVLNGMIESAWKEMDAASIECKEFVEKNRMTYSQVKTDLAALGEDVANLERMRSQANQGISSKGGELEGVTEQLRFNTASYTLGKAQDEEEMVGKRNDLEVVQFVLKLTKCTEASFLQAPALQICEIGAGVGLKLADPALQTEFESKMTPRAKQAFEDSLGRMVASAGAGALGPRSLAQAVVSLHRAEPEAPPSDLPDDDEVAFDEADAAPTLLSLSYDTHLLGRNGSVHKPPPSASKAVPVKETPASGNWRKCVDAKPNCGLLHDTMSLMWGKMKDAVDELQVAMDEKATEFAAMKERLNSQIQILSSAKNMFNQMLGEAISSMNEATEASSGKGMQLLQLQTDYKRTMKECHSKITNILFTDICAVRKVRNSVLTFSSTSPLSAISDCDVSEFVPGPCSVPCDDSCPQPDPYACGGIQTLTREVLVSPNEFSVQCPQLTLERRCNQFRCPKDCVLSRWSTWGKCTKECGGGVQGKTRSVMRKPADGGKSCDTVSEERACATGSCDRDCVLHPWTSWRSCSMGCGGGVQKRFRRIARHRRGAGMCPHWKTPARREGRQCNEQPCVGDEFCVAEMDLVIALDSSGSLRQEGSDLLRDLTARLLSRMAGRYFGTEKMRVGVVQFGNGEILEDGSISPAVVVHSMSSDLVAAAANVRTLQWKRGFTNLAQALSLIETLLQSGGRAAAQSAALVISDCQPSFVFQANTKVTDLKRNGVKMFFSPVADFVGKDFQIMRDMASLPWEAHVVRIPGLEPLKADPDIFASRILVTLCPHAISFSSHQQLERDQGFLLLRAGSSCGEEEALGKADSASNCMYLAQEQGLSAFSYGRQECYGGTLHVTAERVEEWQRTRADPACASGWHGDEKDFYIILPSATVELAQQPKRALRH